MSFRSFFGARKGNPSQSQYKRTTLHMEMLEDRTLLSVSPMNMESTDYAPAIVALSKASEILAPDSNIVVDLGETEQQTPETSLVELSAGEYQLATPKLIVEASGSNSISVQISEIERARSYSLEYSTNSDFENYETLTIRDTREATSITDLNSNTRYFFRVKAIGDSVYSDSEYSATKSVTLGDEVIQLPSPSFYTTVTGSNSISVTVGEVENAFGYALEYSSDSSFSDAQSMILYYKTTNITDLTPDTTYYFRVMAVGSGNYTYSDFSDAKTATTAPENVPDNYNVNDFAKLRAFLELTNSSGVKNGAQLSDDYDSNDPTTWGGVTWELFQGEYRVTQIDWPREWNKELYGDLDLSGFEELTSLSCYQQLELSSIDASGCSSLTELNCESNELTSLDVSACTALTTLNCKYNELISLDVSDNTALTTLNCYGNNLTSLDISSNTSLEVLDADHNRLESLDLSKNINLKTLKCHASYLGALDVSNNTELTYLKCNMCSLTSLDLSNNTKLTYLDCAQNSFTSLDLSNNTALTTLHCYSNKLTDLDLSKCTLLEELDCASNQFYILDLSNNTHLSTLYGLEGQTIQIILPSERANDIACKSRYNSGWVLKDLDGNSYGTNLSSSAELPLCVFFSSKTITFVDSNTEQLTAPPLPTAISNSYTSLTVTVESVPNASGYLLQYADNPSFSNAQLLKVESGETSVEGLNAGTTYYFRVAAYGDGYGASDYGQTFAASTAAPQLSAPELSVSPSGYNAVTVTVGDMENVSYYMLQYADNSSFTNAQTNMISSGANLITGLKADTTYYFRAMAIASGNFSNSDYCDTVTATTPAEPAAELEVNAFVVLRDSLTTEDISAELPTGISSIRAGKTVYADIWVKDVENTDPAIVGGYLNMWYNNDALTVQDVTYGTVFNSLTGYQTFEDGKISTIGGVTTTGVLDKGDDEWVRLATVSFIAETEGSTTVTLGAPENNTYNLTRTDALTLSNDQIFYGSADLDITATCPMDIDGDGYIAVSDYAQLSRAWFSSPGSANWNPACDFDGDGVVAVSDYAILSRNWLKSVDDPDLYFPVVNASPAAAVGSELIVSPYNQIAYSDNAVVDVRLAAVSTKSASDSASDVPASLEQVAPGDSFFVEIWVRNFNGYENSTLCGLTGGYVNMSYNSDILSVDGVTYGSVFSQLNNMQNASTPGYIDTIGGTVSPGVMDKGDDEWVRLATVAFTATGGEGDAAIESLVPSITPYNLTLTSGKTLKNDEIDFGSLNLSISSSLGQLSTPTLTASATGYNSVSVTVGSVEHASTYTVEYSTSDDFANASTKTVTAGTTAITGLTAETTYYFRAFANGSGDYRNSEYSETTSATTLPAPVLEAEVNARVVFQDSLKDADTAAELPEGITSIRATKTVYAEIWVKDVEDADPAIIGGYLNMLYDSDALSVLDVTYGTEICYLTGFQTYENGEIATIGGTTAPSVLDKGDDEWVRLATVSFVADMEGFTTVSLGAPNDYHDNITRTDGRILSNAQIDYGSSVLEVTAACPMDIDGDGYIGVSDYSLLSKAWRSSPGKENWDPACDIDGDGYVGVSDYTFLSKNWRKYADDPDLVYPEPNASPAAAVSENVVIASPAAVVSEDNFIEMSNTAALEADETANVLLTAVSTKTASDTADEVPSSLTEINPGDSFFVEIWVRNFNGYEGSNLCGLTGGYLNMSYPEELLNLGDVTYGRVFSQLNNFQDVSQAGFIDLIGGVAGAGVLDKGDNEWVRLATVSFTAFENGDALIESLPPTDSHDNLTLTSGKTLKNDEISFGVINLKIGSTVIQLKVNNDFIKTTLNNSVVIAYRENDAVADWSKTTVEFGDASNGEYSVNGNGTITYTPEDGFYGTDAVSYVVVDSTGELSTGAIVISVGLPIATSVQKTSGSHSPSSAMAASVERLTDWDNCCVELWAQDVNALNPGETTFTLSYNPTIYNAPYFSACADGVALSVTDSVALPDGSVEVQLTARVLESLSSQTDNLFLGTVVLTPSMDDGAGVVAPLASEPVCALDGAETPTTVEAMPYDLIRNGSVDVNDFVAFATVFGYVPGNMSPVNPLYVQTAKSDFNRDGSVNADDFVLFAINFGATKNTAEKPAPLASAATELVRSEEFENAELIEAQPELKSSLTLCDAYSAALLDLYDNQDVADLSGSSDVLAESRMNAQLFDVESDSSHKASSQAIDAVLEEDLLAIDWN